MLKIAGPNQEGADRPRFAKRRALGCLSLSMLLSALGASITNVALPTLANAFNASFQEVQWVILSYLLAITGLIVSVGRLGDITDRRKLLITGIGLFTAASTLCGLAPSLWFLIGSRAVQGLGAAAMMALTMPLAGEIAGKEKTGTAMGLLGSMSAAGTALGPSLGGMLIAVMGWRSTFAVSASLGMLNFLLAIRYLPADVWSPRSGRAGFDCRGTMLLALTLIVYSFSMVTGRSRFGLFNLALLLVTAIGVGLFLLTQKSTASPLIPLAIFRDGQLSGPFAMSALVSTVMMGTLVIGPFYLTGALHLEAGLVGLIMSAGPIVTALTGMPAGRAVDRFGAPATTIVGLGGIALGSFGLSTLPTTFSVIGYLLPIMVTTAGYGLFQTANNTAVMRNLQPHQRGSISGILNLSRNLGHITGASFMGEIFAFGCGSNDITKALPEAVATGVRVTFATSTVLITLALAWAISSRIIASRPSFSEKVA